MADTQERPIYNTLPGHLMNFLGGKDMITSNIYNYHKTSVAPEITAIINRTLNETIIPYYDSLSLDIHVNNLFRFIKSPFENANLHSGNDIPLIFGIYMSKKGLITSYRDHGTFFRNQKVKQSYENREIFRDKNRIGEIGGGNSNIQFIYDYADKIYVNTSEGILYVGLRINKIISPHWKKYDPKDEKDEERVKVKEHEAPDPKYQRGPKHQKNHRPQKVRQ